MRVLLCLFSPLLLVQPAALATQTVDLALLKAGYKRPGPPPHPADNAPSAARELLGRTLFFDPRLSGSQVISCATCHNPALSFGDGLPRAIGHGMKELGRRTPTVLDVAWSSSFFWDGRASTLEEQALGPIQAPGEMNLPLAELQARIGKIDGYAPLFAAAYPGEPIGAATIAKAIANYERTVVSPPNRFDAWIAGDEAALTEAEKRGFLLFNGKADCDTCHNTWRFTDDGFYDLGRKDLDVGRAAVLPGIPEVEHAFKTPSLRDIDRRYPYMHDGSEATLASVISYYNRGGDVPRPSKAAQIRPLGLTATEQAELLAFLGTLTGPPVPTVVPTLPR
jgi:cytochrome c peroxidase